MICSSGEFVNNYLWKYVDMTITKKEWLHLTNKQVHEPIWIDFFFKFKHIFKDETDIYNYSFVLSNIEETVLKNFIMFYNTNIHRCLKNNHYIKISTIDDLLSFIDNDEDRFKLLLISLYYYF
jgi:hypothetical protein